MTLTKEEEKELDTLMDEQWELDYHILEKLETLIKTDWDAPKLQKELQEDMEKKCKINEKTFPLFEKQEQVEDKIIK